MTKDNKPTLIFDWAAPEGARPLRDRLVAETSEALAIAGASQHSFRSDLTSLYKARGVTDTRVYPVWKTCAKYVVIFPASFAEQIEVVGWKEAKDMVPAPLPPTAWSYIEKCMRIIRSECERSYYDEFFNMIICEGIENGEENVDWYMVMCSEYLTEMRDLPHNYYDTEPLSPDYLAFIERMKSKTPKPKPSKALVPVRSSRVPN